MKGQGGTKEEEKATREECVGGKEEETNSTHEENHVSNRHMTWWQKSLWGPYRQRTTPADGERPSDERGVQPTGPRRIRARQSRTTEGDREERKTEKAEQRSYSLPGPTPLNSSSSNSSGQQFSRSTAQNKIMKERIWLDRIANEIVFQPLHPETGAPLHDEHVIAVQEEPSLHLEFNSEMSQMVCRCPGKCLLT